MFHGNFIEKYNIYKVLVVENFISHQCSLGYVSRSSKNSEILIIKWKWDRKGYLILNVHIRVLEKRKLYVSYTTNYTM